MEAIPNPTYADVAATTPPPEEENALVKDVMSLQHDATAEHAPIVTTPPASTTTTVGSETGEYVGQGMDMSPKGAVRRHKVTSRGPWSSLRSKSPTETDGSKDQTSREVLYENTNGVNGSSLMSVKTPDDYEDALELDEEERKQHNRRKSGDGVPELVSGRQPSAGWERSG
jgi:hypothetical protein